MLFELMIFSHSQNHTIFSWLYKLDQNKTIYIFTIFLNLGLACISSWGEKKRKGREVKKKNKCPTVLSSKIHCPMHAIIKVCCMPWHGLTPPSKRPQARPPPPPHARFIVPLLYPRFFFHCRFIFDQNKQVASFINKDTIKRSFCTQRGVYFANSFLLFQTLYVQSSHFFYIDSFNWKAKC